MKRAITGLVIAPVLFIFLFMMVIGSVIGSISHDDDSGVGAMIPVTFTGTISGSSIRLNAAYSGMTIQGIRGEITDGGRFTANYSNTEGVQKMELPGPPAKLDSFSYMPQFDQSLYSFRLDQNSAQYKLNQICITDERGYRKKVNAYLIALGSYYGSTIGDAYQLRFQQRDGSIKAIEAVLGDQKADQHTDARHQYHTSDGSVVEFIMGGRDHKYAAQVNQDFGTLIGILKKGGAELALLGMIQGPTITITGTLDKVAVLASGTVTDGEIQASGYIGTVTDGGSIGGNVGQWKGGKLGWPLPGYPNITGAYGTNRGDHIHAGIDIGTHGKTGVPCVAAEAGMVVKNVSMAQGGARGHYVDVAHGSNLVTRYQHLAPGTGLPVGTQVNKGQKVGIVGGSGFGSPTAYAYHLHFEVLLSYANGQGQDTNPVPYLK